LHRVWASDAAALTQLAHDTVKRCMLGHRTAPGVYLQERFVACGLLATAAVLESLPVRPALALSLSHTHSCIASQCQDRFSAMQESACAGAVLQVAVRMLLLARTHLVTLLRALQSAVVDIDGARSQSDSPPASPGSPLDTTADEESDRDATTTQTAHAWLESQQAMVRIASCVRALLRRMLHMHACSAGACRLQARLDERTTACRQQAPRRA
jgi:hypothetical protein